MSVRKKSSEWSRAQFSGEPLSQSNLHLKLLNLHFLYKLYFKWYFDVIVYSQEVKAMEGIYLVNYSMKGIKSLDEEVSLSFYKKT